MSVILKRHVEARIAKLKKRLESQDPELVRTEIKELAAARDVVSAKKLRSSLESQIRKLKLSLKHLNPKPIEDELAIWRPVTELMDSHLDYKKRRRTKKSSPPTERSSPPSEEPSLPTEEPFLPTEEPSLATEEPSLATEESPLPSWVRHGTSEE